MNRFFLFSIVSVAIFFVACQESKDDLKAPLSEKDLYKSIGEEIPFEVGMSWIDFHNRKGTTIGRIDSLPSCQIPADKLKLMLSSVSDLVGVAFHYGIDDFGTYHILAIPVNGSMELWPSIADRVIIDANSGAEISQDVAHAWAESFKAANPSEIWYHFFGKKVFDEMLTLVYLETVDIQRATHTQELTPELLLVIWNNQAVSEGRTKLLGGTVYDASNLCPPCALL